MNDLLTDRYIVNQIGLIWLGQPIAKQMEPMAQAVIQQDEDGEFFIVIPEDIAAELDLKPGDDVIWEIDTPADGFRHPSVIMRKA